MTTRVRVLDVRGKPIAGAYGSLVSRHQDRALDGLHRIYARSDAEGWLSLSMLMRGPYDAVVETETLGDLRSVKIRIEVPGPDLECTLPDAHAARLIPTGQEPSASLDSMRGWYRARGEQQWAECTDPKWRFGQNGFVPLPHEGAYDFILSLPPWAGRLVADVPAGEHPIDLSIPMLPEVVIEGRAIDGHGQPVVRVVIAHATTPAEAASVPDWAKAVTDEHGRFQLVLLPGAVGELFAFDQSGRLVARVPAGNGDVVVSTR
jgi:hypothetical protein